MPGKLIFTIIEGSKVGQTVEFDEHDTLLFGRMADCHVCLPEDKTVSRHHFLLEVNPPDARLRDLGSLHGTYITGQKYGGREKHETLEEGAKRQYPQADLHNGDIIKVGKITFQVSVQAVALPAAKGCCQRCGKDLSASIGQASPGDPCFVSHAVNRLRKIWTAPHCPPCYPSASHTITEPARALSSGLRSGGATGGRRNGSCVLGTTHIYA